MHPVVISDPEDSRLDDYRKLTDTALRRVHEPREGLYIAESLKVIERALRAGHRPRSIMTQQRWLSALQPLLNDNTAPVYLVSDDVAEGVTGFPVHRGALAAMHRPALPSVTELCARARTVVVLDGLIEHTNVGSAFRGAAALGADAVIVTNTCADPLYRRAVKVSMGSVFNIPWTRSGPVKDVIAALQADGIHVAALALTPDASDLRVFSRSRPDRVAVVLGTEGEGLDTDVIAAADSTVTIPMFSGVDSLNVATAAAITLWAIGE
ncbi:TrmH family RNA methyltransferase [Microbacterium sp. YY-01]|uniref:TrmH family RNA methyltransferase n=1 Tax=Microbacterium sp. YY-01 TaxID=3421634 RepID=UPI003D16EEB4